MLDAIADFWKPVKKSQAQEKLTPEQLQIGSIIGFGFVPQAALSGRRLEITGINTYQFGDETLTSFVLTQDKETTAGISMIVAEAENEHYLAISRRITLADRQKLFNSIDLENITTKPDVTKLVCRDNQPEFKGWVVASYRREIQGLKGRIFKGDFRKAAMPQNDDAQQFEYTLLVSDSNEHAIEIEKYDDGRVEIYTTIYRRMNDIGEISHPGADTLRPDIKLASSSEKPAAPEAAPAPMMSQPPRFSKEPEPIKTPVPLQEFTPNAAPAKTEEPKPEAAKAPEVKPVEAKAAEIVPEVKPEPVKAPEPKAEAKPATQQPAPFINTPIQEKKPSMENAINGAASSMSPSDAAANSKLYVQSKAPEHSKQEIKAVNNQATGTFDGDSIECDLRVANKIIDEAIRNEMRLTDIVRRIIELPVAYPESVQIPITLTDEDYALLAIRYSLPAGDRNAIKRRILEDLNDFSGAPKKA